MNKLIISTSIILIIFAAAVISYFIFQKYHPEPSISRCGDGICDDKEKINTKLCPRDCKKQQILQNKAGLMSGVKIDNLSVSAGVSPSEMSYNKELTEINFKLAKELGVDYVLIPIAYSDSGWTQKSMDYHHIIDLAKKYNVSILPAFYKLGGNDDKNYEKYANFVISFLDEFYNDKEMNYIELQNEPVQDYNGKMSAHFSGTPVDLAKSNIAAYNKVKEKYPYVNVGTAGFLASAADSNENKVMNSYYKEYFSAKPKFDFLALHFYPKKSSYIQTTKEDVVEYNFLSEAEIYKTYRQLLDDYGYANKPIFVTEGAVDMPFKNVDGPPNFDWRSDDEILILLAERFVLTLSESKEKNIIGLIVSNVKSTESSKNTGLFFFNSITGAYETTKQFNFYKNLLNFFKKYPYYSKRIMGNFDSTNYWVEEFSDAYGKKAWVAFTPFLFLAETQPIIKQGKQISAPSAIKKSVTSPQEIILDMRTIKSVKISSLSETNIMAVKDGKISFTLNKEPLFIEQE